MKRLHFPNWLHLLLANPKSRLGLGIISFIVLLTAIGPFFASKDPNAFNLLAARQAPSWHHLFGTTDQGSDVFAQVVVGARRSLLLGFAAATLATSIATILGVLAAYSGGLVDEGINALINIFLVLPTIPLLIFISGSLKSRGLWTMVLVLGLVLWAFEARILRSQALSLRNRDFLAAARVRGERQLYIVVVEVIPTMTSLLVACFLTNALYAVLFASSLQFIGLGDPNTVSWGTMLYWAQNNAALQTGQPMWAIAPGACIAALGAAFALLNYAFDEIGNPALRPVRRTRVKRAG